MDASELDGSGFSWQAQKPCAIFPWVKISIITVEPEKRRKADPDKVQEIMTSIQENGLLHPITLYHKKGESKLKLGAGGHRLEAVKQLGWDSVPAKIVEVDDEEDAIDLQDTENLARKDYSAFEVCVAHARQRKRFLTKHPEAGRGGDRRSSKRQNDALIGDSYYSFAKRQTGEAESTIQHEARIGDILRPEAERIVGSSIEDSMKDLSELASMHDTERDRILDLISNGSANSVAEAKKTLFGSRLPVVTQPSVNGGGDNTSIDQSSSDPENHSSKASGKPRVSAINTIPNFSGETPFGREIHESEEDSAKTKIISEIAKSPTLLSLFYDQPQPIGEASKVLEMWQNVALFLVRCKYLGMQREEVERIEDILFHFLRTYYNVYAEEMAGRFEATHFSAMVLVALLTQGNDASDRMACPLNCGKCGFVNFLPFDREAVILLLDRRFSFTCEKCGAQTQVDLHSVFHNIWKFCDDPEVSKQILASGATAPNDCMEIADAAKEPTAKDDDGDMLSSRP